jgi:hypothetical protein
MRLSVGDGGGAADECEMGIREAILLAFRGCSFKRILQTMGALDSILSAIKKRGIYVYIVFDR